MGGLARNNKQTNKYDHLETIYIYFYTLKFSHFICIYCIVNDCDITDKNCIYKLFGLLHTPVFNHLQIVGISQHLFLSNVAEILLLIILDHYHIPSYFA